MKTETLALFSCPEVTDFIETALHSPTGTGRVKAGGNFKKKKKGRIFRVGFMALFSAINYTYHASDLTVL